MYKIRSYCSQATKGIRRQKKQWSVDVSMITAMEAIKDGILYQATLLHRVPPTTLKDRTIMIINIICILYSVNDCLIFLVQNKYGYLG